MAITSNTPTNATAYQSQRSPYNEVCYGMALLDFGICQITQVNGFGLLTGGFIWQGPEIWFKPQEVDGIITGWTAAAGYSGCAAASLVTTSWTASQTFGNEFPA